MPKVIEVAGEKFTYYERFEWGSRNTSPPVDSDGPEPMTFLHHAGANHNNPTILRQLSVQEEMAHMREWQAYCIDRAGQGWSDIPYNIGVFPFSGNVYEARGWRAKSGATAGQNEDSKAVCMLGNNVPTAGGFAIALNNAALVMVWGVLLGELVKVPQVLGHWENPKHYKATTCPGFVDMNWYRTELFGPKLRKAFNITPPAPVPEPTPIPVPTPPVMEGDVEFVLVIPEMSNARFFALRDKGTGFIFSMGWIDTEAKYNDMKNYYKEVRIEKGAENHILLIGPVPRGDTLRNWSISDFLNAPN